MLKTVLVQVEETALDALKATGTVLEGFVITEGQKLVAEAKQSDLGSTALNLVAALESHNGTGAEKMEMLVAAVVPAIVKFIAVGGLAGLATSVESFALEFGQSVFNDFRALMAVKATEAKASVIAAEAAARATSAQAPAASV
jgi:hypothetical protein